MIMEIVAKKFKNLRMQSGFTQQYVADSIGVSLSTLSRIENNPGEAKGNQLDQLAKFYKTTLGKIFSEDEKQAQDLLDGIKCQITIPASCSSEQLIQAAKELQKTEKEKQAQCK